MVDQFFGEYGKIILLTKGGSGYNKEEKNPIKVHINTINAGFTLLLRQSKKTLRQTRKIAYMRGLRIGSMMER